MTGWAVIVTEPQRERKLGAVLQEAGFEVFVPTYLAWRGRHSRFTEVRRPLINGYVFAMMQPHQIHDFTNDGAIRLLPMNWRHSLALAFKVQAWRDLIDDGVFDEPEPKEPKPLKVRTRRNRKARRHSGEAKRESVKMQEGLEAILAEMLQPQPVAA